MYSSQLEICSYQEKIP